MSPSHGVLTQNAGQSQRPASSELEHLRGAAHAAVETGNWSLLRALEPLIDGEAKRAAASVPVSLEAVRTRREGK